MGKSVVRFGDPDVAHCSGMTRKGKSSNVFANGIGVSRQGDVNTTHLLPPNIPPCGTHSAGITTGSTTVFANGKGLGRRGDAISGCTSCGQGSTNVFAGG
jgi:uncharacterized Zn-binding protein involved in type VI secretion